ncbi:autoinducer binding domain-containing protein [Streptomyces sp. NPDC048665]|uniref:autoinducer binding domain-containing protein n=1 Tax=Streptomyces sp. NPDC048665 TaxID=3155490 RepID=UPI00341956A2
MEDPYGYLHGHPAPRHHCDKASMAPIRVSDVIGPRAWRQSRTYAELAGSMGMRYELIVPLVVSSREYSALGILRADRDLTDSDRETAARLQPVLIGLHTLAARVVRPPPPDSFAGQLTLPKRCLRVNARFCGSSAAD